MGKIISWQEWAKSGDTPVETTFVIPLSRRPEPPKENGNPKPEDKPVVKAREEFLEKVQKLGFPVNILGRKDYERWLNGPEDSTWCTKNTRVCLHAAMKLNGVEDWQVTPLQQEFLIKCTSKLMQEYTPDWLLENASLLQEQLMMLFQET